MDQLISFRSDAFPSDVHVVALRGREALSVPYELTVGLLCTDADVDIDAAVRARATVAVHSGNDAPPFEIHGILATVEQLQAWAGKALYRAVIVPTFWNLHQSVHSRIYTNNTIVEIIEAVLEHGGLTTDDYELRLRGSYGSIEHVCQYKESDLAFLSRWMEREGIYYFFEHGEEREKLIITDTKSSHDEIRTAPARYVPLSGADAMALEAFDRFACKRSALPSSFALADYDYLNPTLDVAGSATVAADGVGEIRIFGKGFLTPEEGARLASVRAEEILARQHLFHGRGRVFSLRSGYTFSLEEHPRAAFNQKYLVVELEHYANQSGADDHIKQLLELGGDDVGVDEYGVRVVAIPASVQYRAPERQRWPRIEGYELAVVCGEAESPYAQLDEHGRYRVRIMFDESDLVDGSASTWVRMLQPHGGGNEGFHFPLRKGTEILLFFLGGDPDRPVIAGTAPNARTPSPVTSGNHTLNVIQTGGLNRIEMKDDDGLQHVKISSPPDDTHIHLGAPNEYHSLHVCTSGNSIYFVGKDWSRFVGGDNFEWIIGNDTLVVAAGNQGINVMAGKKTEHVAKRVQADYDDVYKLTVGALNDVTVKGPRSDHVVGKVTETYDAGQKTTVTGAREDTVTGAVKEEYGSLDTKVKSEILCEIGGHKVSIKKANDTELTYGVKNEAFLGVKRSLNVGSFTEVSLAGKDEAFIGAKNELKVGGFTEISIAVKMELALALKMAVIAGAKLEIDGSVDLGSSTAEVKNSAAAKIAQTTTRLYNQAIALFS